MHQSIIIEIIVSNNVAEIFIIIRQQRIHNSSASAQYMSK